MKKKYDRLTKEEKKECRTMYYQTIKGKEMKIRFVRLTLIGTIGILFGIYLLGNGIIAHQIAWYDYLIIISLWLASIIFLGGVVILRKRVLNQFAIKIPRFRNK